MNIAIYHNLPSGGGKRALYEMARGLAQRHTLDVFSLSTADHDYCDLRPLARQHTVYPFEPLPLARPPFGRLNQGIRALDLLRLRRLQRAIAARINVGGYDVAFVHPCRYGTSPSILRFLTVPSAYYLQEPPRLLYEPAIVRPYSAHSALDRAVNHLDPLPSIYRRTLAREDRVSLSSATRVLVNSCYSRESVYRIYGVDATVCYLGVDTETFRPLPAAKGNYLLSVGMVNPHKGYDFVLRSLALIAPNERPPLVICGNAADAYETAYLRRLAVELNVQVDLRTLVTDAELVTLYNGALLTVYAPVMEPFGLVALESMACGTPVVGVREAGVRETVVDGVTGLLVDRDAAAFAEALRGLLAHHDLRASMGSAARAHVEQHWTWPQTDARLEQILSAVWQG